MNKTMIQRDFKRFFRPKTGDLRKKKRSSSQKCHEIRCQPTKITKIPVANTTLGLDLHSSSPEPVNFFGAQYSLGGHKQSFGGSRPRYVPRGAGSDSSAWKQLLTNFNHSKLQGLTGSILCCYRKVGIN